MHPPTLRPRHSMYTVVQGHYYIPLDRRLHVQLHLSTTVFLHSSQPTYILRGCIVLSLLKILPPHTGFDCTRIITAGQGKPTLIKDTYCPHFVPQSVGSTATQWRRLGVAVLIGGSDVTSLQLINHLSSR